MALELLTCRSFLTPNFQIHLKMNSTLFLPRPMTDSGHLLFILSLEVVLFIQPQSWRSWVLLYLKNLLMAKLQLCDLQVPGLHCQVPLSTVCAAPDSSPAALVQSLGVSVDIGSHGLSGFSIRQSCQVHMGDPASENCVARETLAQKQHPLFSVVFSYSCFQNLSPLSQL